MILNGNKRMRKHVKNSKRKAKFPPSCGCKTYLIHWEKATKLNKPQRCSKLGCSNTARVGAHIFNCSDTSSNKLMIVPLCNACNNPANSECFYLKKNVKTPSASKMKSC